VKINRTPIAHFNYLLFILKNGRKGMVLRKKKQGSIAVQIIDSAKMVVYSS